MPSTSTDRSLVLQAHLVGERQQGLQLVVAGAQHLLDLPLGQRHAPLEHLLTCHVEDVGPGHLCGHGADCSACSLASGRLGARTTTLQDAAVVGQAVTA
jgi:hypothetical protein